MIPKNLVVLFSKVYFFIKQLTNTFILCEIYQKKDIIDAYIWIKYTVAIEKQENVREINKLNKQTIGLPKKILDMALLQ